MKKELLLILTILFFNPSLFAQLKSFETEVTSKENMKFYLYTPIEKQDVYPLVVFLHGGGQSGSDLNLVKEHGLPKLINEGKNFPFYVFAPQNPNKNGLWDDKVINKMVDHLVDSLSIDTKRIYLTGLSRGGDGIWRMAVNNPNKYAAMLSVCAANIPMVYINWVPNLPVWFFHGEKDSIVPVEQTIQAYEKLKQFNPDAKLTLYPNADHDSWTETFENDAIFIWLLSHKLK
ncbi:carboxylesterase family protein [Mariniflexile sp.]|uniref:carboxylesterase family protein n=1 Tax=Mariniflexile sp. TaxID=1979402 RepID=UPI0040484A9E